MLHVLTTKASKKRLDVNPNCSNFSINPPDKKVKDDNYTVIFFSHSGVQRFYKGTCHS